MDKNDNRPQTKVLQQMQRDNETREEIRTLIADSEEIHEVIAMAWEGRLQEMGQGGETDLAKF